MQAPAQVPGLMRELERGPLRDYKPCRFDNTREQATALAVVHGELILYSPVSRREGRCSRSLAFLMGLQAGLLASRFRRDTRGEEEGLHRGNPHQLEPRPRGNGHSSREYGFSGATMRA